jgi:hypothetical protein
MRVCRIGIKNFRGIKSATLLLPKHGVLIGDNNTGKTTALEALDLALGPDRLNRQPPVDEHDFFEGADIAKTPVNDGNRPTSGDGVVQPSQKERATHVGQLRNYFGINSYTPWSDRVHERGRNSLGRSKPTKVALNAATTPSSAMR